MGQTVTQKRLVLHKEGNQKQNGKWRVKKNICESVESLKEGGVHFTNCTSVFQIDRTLRLYTISPSYSDELAWVLCKGIVL